MNFEGAKKKICNWAALWAQVFISFILGSDIILSIIIILSSSSSAADPALGFSFLTLLGCSFMKKNTALCVTEEVEGQKGGEVITEAKKPIGKQART